MTDVFGADAKLEKRAEAVGAPLPSELAPNARGFEVWISAGLVPLVGLNLFLLGCLELGRNGGDARRYAAAASFVFGAVAISAVVPKARDGSYADYGGIGLAGMLLGGSFGWPALTPVLTILMVAAMFAGVVVQRVHGRGFVLLAMWVPVLLREAKVSSPAFLVTVTFVPPILLLVRRRAFGAAFVLLSILVGYGGLEVQQGNAAGLVTFVICAAGVVLAVVYEVASMGGAHSTFRILLGQVPAIAAMAFLVWAFFPSSLDKRAGWWLLATLWALYHGLRLMMERSAAHTPDARRAWPVRVIWIGMSVAMAVLNETDLVSGPSIALQLVLVGAALNMASVVTRHRAVSNAGVLVLVLAGVILYFSDTAGLGAVLGFGFAGSALVLASARHPVEPALPWWSGFIREAHAELIVSTTRKALDRIAAITFVKLVFGWVSVTVLWIRFALSASARSDVRPVVNALGHGTLALLVTRQLVDWAAIAVPDRDAMFEPALTTALSITYGVLLVTWGVRKDRFFTRLIGLILISAPAVLRFVTLKSVPEEEFAWVMLLTGIGLAAAGFYIKQVPRPPEPNDADAEPPPAPEPAS